MVVCILAEYWLWRLWINVCNITAEVCVVVTQCIQTIGTGQCGRIWSHVPDTLEGFSGGLARYRVDNNYKQLCWIFYEKFYTRWEILLAIRNVNGMNPHDVLQLAPSTVWLTLVWISPCLTMLQTGYIWRSFFPWASRVSGSRFIDIGACIYIDMFLGQSRSTKLCIYGERWGSGRADIEVPGRALLCTLIVKTEIFFRSTFMQFSPQIRYFRKHSSQSQKAMPQFEVYVINFIFWLLF